MARNPIKVKMIARHLLSQIPRASIADPRDLIALSEAFADFSEHPKMDGHAIRMAASQILSAPLDGEVRP